MWALNHYSFNSISSIYKTYHICSLLSRADFKEIFPIKKGNRSFCCGCPYRTRQCRILPMLTERGASFRLRCRNPDSPDLALLN